MTIPEIPWKNSIFSRLMITLLCVMIPIYILGFVIYNWGMNTIRKEIINSNSSKITFMQSNFESEIKRIKILQYGCLNDRDLLDLANKTEIMTEYEKNMSVLRLQKTLYSIKSSSKYILDVKAYIPTFGMTISSLANTDMMDLKEYNQIRSLSSISPSQIFYKNNSLILPSNIWVNGISKSDAQSPLIIVELSKDEIVNTMNTFNDYQHSGYIIMDSVQKYSIFGSKDIDLCEKIKNIALENQNAVESYTARYKLDTGDTLVFYQKSAYLNMLFIKYVSEGDIFRKVKEYRVWFVVFSFVSLIIIIFASISSFKYIHQPLQKIVKAFYMVQKGEMNVLIESKRHDEFGYLYERYNDMINNLRTLIDQVYKQTIMAQKAELKQLQSQINPHFLYNSFFIISTLIKTEDYDNARVFTRQLGEYFQFITRSAADEITLSREVEHAQVYSAIQCARFGSRIKVDFCELPAEAAQIIVPRLILQPLLENTFEHGLCNVKGNANVRILFEMPHSKVLLISIEDNGNNVDDQSIIKINEALESTNEMNEVTGLVNIYRRIQLKFGSESGAYATRSEFGGLKFVIRIVNWGDENVQTVNC